MNFFFKDFKDFISGLINVDTIIKPIVETGVRKFKTKPCPKPAKVAEKEILPVLQKVEFNKSIEGQAAEELSDILKRTADELRQSGQNLTADAIMDRLKDELNTTETVPK